MVLIYHNIRLELAWQLQPKPSHFKLVRCASFRVLANEPRMMGWATINALSQHSGPYNVPDG